MSGLFGTLRDRFRDHLAAVPDGGVGDPEPFLAALGATDFAPAEPARPIPNQRRDETLNQALSGIACRSELDAAVSAAADDVAWYRMLEDAPVDESLGRGLVVGQIGRAVSTPLLLGLFLLSPRLSYPLHQHGALEIYAPVSGTLRVRHGLAGTSFDVPPGGWSITPAHRLHALETGENPCLLIYAWIDDIGAPGYWWDRNDAGNWRRARWNRREDGRWMPGAAEPVDDTILREAGEIGSSRRSGDRAPVQPAAAPE